MRTKFNAIALGTGALVAALTVVGCGAAGQAAGPANQQAPTQSSPAQSTGGQVAASHSTDGGTCTTANLAAKLGSKKRIPVDPQGQLGAAGTHYQISLVWTNTSQAVCSLRGFGGVDLDGPNLGQAGGPTYSLPRAGDTPTTVTLAPGASAHTVISYIDPTGSNPDTTQTWTPTHLMATPPNQTTHISVPWTAGTPVYFDPEDGVAAANIGPVTAGS